MRFYTLSLVAITTIAGAFSLGGCVSTLNKAGFEEAVSRSRTQTVSDWYYVGTHAGYHYFRNETLLSSKKYRVPVEQLHVASAFPLASDRAQWLRLPVGPWRPQNDPDVDADFLQWKD